MLILANLTCIWKQFRLVYLRKGWFMVLCSIKNNIIHNIIIATQRVLYKELSVLNQLVWPITQPGNFLPLNVWVFFAPVWGCVSFCGVCMTYQVFPSLVGYCSNNNVSNSIQAQIFSFMHTKSVPTARS